MRRNKKEIRIRKRKIEPVVHGGFLSLSEFMQRAFDNLPERVKQRVLFSQGNREQKKKALKLGYNPYN